MSAYNEYSYPPDEPIYFEEDNYDSADSGVSITSKISYNEDYYSDESQQSYRSNRLGSYKKYDKSKLNFDKRDRNYKQHNHTDNKSRMNDGTNRRPGPDFNVRRPEYDFNQKGNLSDTSQSYQQEDYPSYHNAPEFGDNKMRAKVKNTFSLGQNNHPGKSNFIQFENDHRKPENNYKQPGRNNYRQPGRNDYRQSENDRQPGRNDYFKIGHENGSMNNRKGTVTYKHQMSESDTDTSNASYSYSYNETDSELEEEMLRYQQAKEEVMRMQDEDKLKKLQNGEYSSSDYDSTESSEVDYDIVEERKKAQLAIAKINIKNRGLVQENVNRKKNNMEYVNTMRDVAHRMDKEELLSCFESVREKWVQEEYKTFNFHDAIELGMVNFGVNESRVEYETLTAGYKKCLHEIAVLHMCFMKQNIMQYNDVDYSVIFEKIFEILHYTFKCVSSAMRIKLAMDPMYDYTMNDDTGLFRFTPIDYSKNNPYQNLLLYILSTLSEHGYRKYREYCYEPIYSETGNYTYSWRENVSIKDFIYSSCQKEVTYEQWYNLTSSKDNAKKASEFLEECNDPQFPKLVKDRHIYSFKNGVYITRIDIPDADDPDEVIYTDGFFAYDDPTVPIEGGKVANKYFDQYFNNYDDIEAWTDIPTPNFHRIIEYQYKMEPECDEICKWMYVFVGRMLYEVNEIEEWQVIAFLKGVAGCGKSTILTKVVKEFFEPNDIGIMSNNSDKAFGLSGFYDKLAFIAPEVKGDLGVDQASLQGIISGEDVVVNIKHVTPKALIWTAPGMLGGNETPDFSDNSGSMSRRLVVFGFPRKVKRSEVDPRLSKKLKLEIPTLLKKCNAAYLESVNKYGKKDVWPVLPKYFIKNQREIAEQTNSLQHFLASGKIIYHKDIYCRESVFKQFYQNHCKENNFRPKRFTPELYIGVFQDVSEKQNHEIVFTKEMKKIYPINSGRVVFGSFITGLDINVDEETKTAMLEYDSEEEKKKKKNEELLKNKIKVVKSDSDSGPSKTETPTGPSKTPTVIVKSEGPNAISESSDIPVNKELEKIINVKPLSINVKSFEEDTTFSPDE